MENQKVLKNISLIKNKINLYKKNLQIIAISKKQPLERVIAALDFGHKIYGENQVQETINKWPHEKTCIAFI